MAKPLPPARPGALLPADAALDVVESAASSAAIDTFVKALGGRDALLDTLAVAADAPEVDRIVSLLLDPRYADWSLRRLCRDANLTIVDLFAAYKSAMITRAHLTAYRTITARLLPVVEDVMQRAAPYEVPCHECSGIGTVAPLDKKGKPIPDAAPVPCDQCRGHGRVLCMPDLDRQKLALELGQLVQKAGGLIMQQNSLTLNSAGEKGSAVGSSFLDLQQAVRSIVSGPRQPLPTVNVSPVVEAEVVDSPPPLDPAP